MDLHVLLTRIALVSICRYVRTSQETHLWTSTASYGDSFPFLYVDDVRTSQETPTGPPRLLRG
jgi:hypothetical protein